MEAIAAGERFWRVLCHDRTRSGPLGRPRRRHAEASHPRIGSRGLVDTIGVCATATSGTRPRRSWRPPQRPPDARRCGPRRWCCSTRATVMTCIWWRACWSSRSPDWFCLRVTAAMGSGARSADTWNPVTPVCALLRRESFEEAALVAHIHPMPIDVQLSSYRCRTNTEPVMHLDVLFRAVVAEPTPTLVASDELAELDWFDRVLPSTLTVGTAINIARTVAAVRGRGLIERDGFAAQTRRVATRCDTATQDVEAMNLSEWADRQGVHPQIAYRWFREGTLPCHRVRSAA